MADYDTSTPCGRAAMLKDVLLQFLSGKIVASVSFNSGNGTSQSASYSKSEIAEIRKQLNIEEAACNKALGLAPQRHAIGSGYAPNKRNGYGPFYT